MNKTLTYALIVFLAGSSYGFVVPIVKIAASHDVSVADILPAQYIVAFVAAVAVTAVRRIPLPSPSELLKLAVMGLLAASTSLCYYRAVAVLPSTVALTLLFQFVWIGIVIECIASRALPNRRTVAAVAVVLAGTLLAAGVFEESLASLNPVGVLFGLGSALFYSLFLFFSGRIGTQYAVPVRTIMLAVGGFTLASICNPAFFTEGLPNTSMWPFALALGVVGVLMPTSLIAFASPKLPPSVVTVMASSELPMGVLCAWAIIGDTPTPLALVGVVLVLAGIVYNQLPGILASRSRKSMQ